MFEVHMLTWCDGWTNVWNIEDEEGRESPEQFLTAEQAQAEIDDFLKEIREEIESGERDKDVGYDEVDFCIYDLKNEKYI